MSESRSMLITCGWIFLELKKKYSVFLGLADNLLATNQEKTSVMQDSITDMVDNACARENGICLKWNNLRIIRIEMTTDAEVF